MIRWSTTIVVVLLAGIAAVVSFMHLHEVIVRYGEAGFTSWLIPAIPDGIVYAASMVLLDAAHRGRPTPFLAWLALGFGIAATLTGNVLHGLENGPLGAMFAALPAVGLVLAFELLMILIRGRAVEVVAVPVVPEPVAAVSVTVAETATVEVESVSGDTLEVERAARRPAVPEPVAAVPPQVNGLTLVADLRQADLDPEPAFSDQVQPDNAAELDAPYRPVAVARFLSDVLQGEPPTVRTIKDDMSVGTDRARRLRAYLGQLVEVAR